ARWVRSISIRKPGWQPFVYLSIRLAAAMAYPLCGILANDDIFLDIALQSWYHKGLYLLATVNALAMCIPEVHNRYARMGVFALRLTTSGFMLVMMRSEEHTSELQSREKLVCRLLLEKKKSTSASKPIRSRRR